MNLELPILSILCALSGAIVGYLGHRRTENKELREKAAKETFLDTKLDYISKGVDDIRLDMKVLDKRLNALEQKVIILEENNKVLNKKVDSL